MTSMTTVSVSMHPKDGEEFRLEYVNAHDTVANAYYRLKFGDEITVFLSPAQVNYLTMILKGGGQ